MPFAGTFVIEMDGNEPSKTLATQIRRPRRRRVLISGLSSVGPARRHAAPDGSLLRRLGHAPQAWRDRGTS
jgi:hypothetical protein